MVGLRQIDEYTLLLDYTQFGPEYIGDSQIYRKLKLMGKEITVMSNLKYPEYADWYIFKPTYIELIDGSRLDYWQSDSCWGNNFEREFFYNTHKLYWDVRLGNWKEFYGDTDFIDGRVIFCPLVCWKSLCIALDLETVLSLNYTSLDLRERELLDLAICSSEPFMRSIPRTYFQGKMSEWKTNEAYAKYMMILAKMMLMSKKEKRIKAERWMSAAQYTKKMLKKY